VHKPSTVWQRGNAMHLSTHVRARLTGLGLAAAVAVTAAACASSHAGTGTAGAPAHRLTRPETSRPAAPPPATSRAAASAPAAPPGSPHRAHPAPAVTVATSPAAAFSSNLASVSCPDGSWCMAVGSWSASQQGPGRTLAEVWNGASWRILAVPDPAGSAASSLTSVSCTSATRCMAVGEYGTATFAEAWNGASWQILTTPALASSSLTSVSCTSAGCMAVGGYGTRALTEAWNGTSWRALTTPSPAGTASSSLTSVSCTSAGCMAVGNSTGIEAVKGSGPYAEAWNGTSWQLLTVPGPASLAYNGLGLAGISCAKTTSCMTTGGFLTNPGVNSRSSTLAEAWNDSRWRVLQPLNP
jgi:hypothetical protein